MSRGPARIVLFLLVLIVVVVVAWPGDDDSKSKSNEEQAKAQLDDETVEGEGEALSLSQDVNNRGAPADGAVPATGDAIVAHRVRIQSLRDEGHRKELRTVLSETVLSDAFPARLRERSLEELRDLNDRVVFRGVRTVLAHEAVVVSPGQNLTRIARNVKTKVGNNVTPAMIMLVNGLRTTGLQAGQRLAVPTGQITVVCKKRDYRIYVLVGDQVVRDFPVGLGRDDSTPLGEYTVRGKTKEPTWKMPDGRVLPYGHAEHVIGSRWMGFHDSKGRTGYGIHGTTDETSIGKDESDGCIRLGKAAVEELFDLVPEGARVIVRN